MMISGLIAIYTLCVKNAWSCSKDIFTATGRELAQSQTMEGGGLGGSTELNGDHNNNSMKPQW